MLFPNENKKLSSNISAIYVIKRNILMMEQSYPFMKIFSMIVDMQASVFSFITCRYPSTISMKKILSVSEFEMNIFEWLVMLTITMNFLVRTGKIPSDGNE